MSRHTRIIRTRGWTGNRKGGDYWTPFLDHQRTNKGRNLGVGKWADVAKPVKLKQQGYRVHEQAIIGAKVIKKGLNK